MPRLTDHEESGGKLKGGVVNFLMRQSESSSVGALIILWIVFSVGNNSFNTPYNIFNVFRTSSEYYIIAMAQVFVVIVSGMNLSIAGIGGLSAITVGYCLEVLGLPPLAAVVLGALVGMGCGYFNGILITKLRINSFIVTLATSFIFGGLVKGLTEGFPFSKIPASVTWIAKNDIAGTVPLIFVIMIASAVFFRFFFKYSVLGRELLATGGAIEAAKMSGINTDRIILQANILSGLMAGFAGLFTVARMSAASPLIGDDWMIMSFAVAVIGGTALSGGKVTMVGVCAASILITIIKNGLIMLHVNVYFLNSFLGAIIIAAVILEVVREKYNERYKN
ncbi:MAG: ABC transporter permease [Clostridiales Family XIII bacterium]|jgi:ribose transport system permease protein|nr:ABC transporter permease [Clostridiales Family XIII bacterium]